MVLLSAATALSACSGGNHTLPSAMPNASGALSVAATGKGIAAPVAIPTTLAFSSLGATNAKTFVVTVQFAGDLNATSANANVATVNPQTATPVLVPGAGGSKSATFTVTPTGPGTTTITVTDKKGQSASITVTVTLAHMPKYVFTTYGIRSTGPSSIAWDANEFDAFAASANGVVSPTYSVVSNSINNPVITSGPNGDIWLANGLGTNGGNIMVLPPMSAVYQQFGTLPTPIAVISGSNTRISYPRDIAVDGTGNVFVLSVGYPTISTGIPPMNHALSTIERFAPGSNGNVAPASVLPVGNAQTQTTLQYPADIATTANGTLYVADLSSNPAASVPPAGNIAIFAPDASGDVAPIAVLGGSNTEIDYPSSVSLDANGNIYVLTNDSFAAASQLGDNGVPIADVNPRILVFPPNAHGNVAPMAVIEGPATGLDAPVQLRVDPSGGVYVADYGARNVDYFASGDNGDTAPLRVFTDSMAQSGYGFSAVGI